MDSKSDKEFERNSCIELGFSLVKISSLRMIFFNEDDSNRKMDDDGLSLLGRKLDVHKKLQTFQLNVSWYRDNFGSLC